MIKANLKRLSLEFRSRADIEKFLELYTLRLDHPELKIPLGLDRYFVLSQDASEAKLAPLARRFHAEEHERFKASILEAEREMKELASKPTAANRKKMEVRERRILKLKGKLDFSFDRISPLDERIYPGTFAPVILTQGKERLLVPMRYRVRRTDGGEVPSQYNVFNARRDSLLSAPTWKPLFGHSHAVFPFVKFFEWVERAGKKQEIAFSPENRAMMWAASLFSAPRAKDALPFLSFAMVTDEPPSEVAEAGHDRCPIFLKSDLIDTWLQPQGRAPNSLLEILDHKEKTFYLHDLVA